MSREWDETFVQAVNRVHKSANAVRTRIREGYQEQVYGLVGIKGEDSDTSSDEEDRSGKVNREARRRNTKHVMACRLEKKTSNKTHQKSKGAIGQEDKKGESDEPRLGKISPGTTISVNSEHTKQTLEFSPTDTNELGPRQPTLSGNEIVQEYADLSLIDEIRKIIITLRNSLAQAEGLQPRPKTLPSSDELFTSELARRVVQLMGKASVRKYRSEGSKRRAEDREQQEEGAGGSCQSTIQELELLVHAQQEGERNKFENQDSPPDHNQVEELAPNITQADPDRNRQKDWKRSREEIPECENLAESTLEDYPNTLMSLSATFPKTLPVPPATPSQGNPNPHTAPINNHKKRDNYQKTPTGPHIKTREDYRPERTSTSSPRPPERITGRQWAWENFNKFPAAVGTNNKQTSTIKKIHSVRDAPAQNTKTTYKPYDRASR